MSTGRCLRGDDHVTKHMLGPEREIVAAYLSGAHEAGDEASARGYRDWLDRGEPARAARCALWLALLLLLRGEDVRSNGWHVRAGRLLDEARLDCVERGYLLGPVGLRSLAAGDAATAHATFARARTIGERFADADLIVLGHLGEGQALIGLGRRPRASRLWTR